jgi:hypothetical protein
MIDQMLSLQKSQPEYYTDQIIKGLIQVSALNLLLSMMYTIPFGNFFDNHLRFFVIGSHQNEWDRDLLEFLEYSKR